MPYQLSRLALLLALPVAVVQVAAAAAQNDAAKIAVVGGAISGSFVTKYLADYDLNCSSIDSITVFEPVPLKGPVDVTTTPDDDWQASRVQSLRLKDGTIAELGASIAFREFHLVNEMIRNDPENLVAGRPFNTGSNETDEKLRKGMGIYSGNGRWSLLTSNKYINKMILMWRYGWDLIVLNRVCDQMLEAFAKLPTLMDSNDLETFFQSPDQVWESIGLRQAVHTSFDDFLDGMGITRDLPKWRELLPYQKSLRKELLTAINLVNYNQDNSQVNGIVGLGSFAASSGGLFSIVGGNVKLIDSALRQAHQTSQEACGGESRIKEIQKKVTTVVGSVEGLTLYSDEETLGTYDIVILAAPIQQSRIEFLVQSMMDEAVLQPMPMGALVQPETQETDEGHQLLPNRLLSSAVDPYTQVVTTVVSNATLAAENFAISESYLPRSLLMTSDGKASLHNITAITQVKSTGVYKLFSNDKLSDEVLTSLFGPGHVVEYVKFWGGPHGGATPDYQGKGAAQDFVLHDGAMGVEIEGHTSAGVLYYPSAMEQSSLASIELSALGARAVAKLVARRVGLIEARVAADGSSSDEL